MRVLLITADVPATSSMAGSPRVFSFFKYIARRHEVHLATFPSSLWSSSEGDNGKYDNFLRSEEAARVFQTIRMLPTPREMSFWGTQFHRLVQAPFFITRYRSPDEFRSIQRLIVRVIERTNPDVIFVDRLPAAQYVLDLTSIPRVVDAHDAASLNFRRRADFASSRWEKLGLLLESHSIRRFEVATARAVDAYLVNSPIDRQVLQAYHRDMRVTCIPNGVDADYFAPNGKRSDERTLIFTGVMSYSPNRDAAHFLCKEILPRVKAVVPQVQVQVVGSNPPADVQSLAGDGVTVTGTVPDIRPYVHGATVYVSPLRFGTGVKNKILAALAMEKAIVASPESCAGLDVIPGKHLVVATGPDEYAALILSLLADRNRRRELGVAGRELVLERYTWKAMGRELEAVLESAIVRHQRQGHKPARKARMKEKRQKIKGSIKSLAGRAIFTPRAHHVLLGNAAVIVAFHRINRDSTGDGLTCGVDLFKKYCKFFSDYFHVIPMRDLLDKLESGVPLDRNLVITFDDGYQDNYKFAAPILKSLDLPATVFLTSQFVGTDVVPWWDAQRGVKHPWMTWDEVRELHAQGFEIGAHTRTHANLAEICGLQAREEILGSRRDLEERLCAPVDLFAYPYGKKDQITERNRDIIKEGGLRCCCSCYGGINTSGTDPFHLRRIPISSWYESPHEFAGQVALGRA